METAKKKDFVEIKFTGYTNGSVFDSNIEEDLKKIDPKGKPKETIIIVGEGMVIPGLDKDIEGKELGKEYEVTLSPTEAFGNRDSMLVRTIPLKIFREKNVNPYPGMVLAMDNSVARVITISGARVITDFNNPLAGKEVKFKYKIARKIEDEKDKAKVVIELLFKFIPEFEVKGQEVIIKGPKVIGEYINVVKEKFKELSGKTLGFEEKDLKAEKSSEESKKGE